MKLSPSQPAAAALRAFALTFPESHEEFPWGESAFKVKGKVFVFLRADPSGLSFTVKLPRSNERALAQPFAESTGYGLGKSGWVTCKFAATERVPVEDLKPWIEESYRAVAPKTLVKQLDGGASAPAQVMAQSKPLSKKTHAPAKSSKKAVAKAPKARARKRG